MRLWYEHTRKEKQEMLNEPGVPIFELVHHPGRSAVARIDDVSTTGGEKNE